MKRWLLVLWLALGLAGSAQEVLGTNAFCQQFGQDLVKANPALREGRVHWLIGVDCSGSMLGKLDPLKAMLQVWLKLVAVPGDRISIEAFDRKTGPIRTFDVNEDYASLAGRINPLLSVHSGRGTALDQARSLLASTAAADQAREPSWVYLTVILSDRDDADQGGAAPSTSAGDSDEQQYLYVVSADGQKKVGLRALIRALKQSAPAQSAGGVRKVPLAEPREQITPGSDPDASLKRTLGVLPWVPLVLAVLLLGWLFGPDAPGLFLRNPGGKATAIPWWIGRARSTPIHVSRNRSDFCLEPAREGLGDRLVATAMMANPWAPGSWKTRLVATEGHSFGATEDQQLELPCGSHQLVVKDKNGVVVDRPIVLEVRNGTLNLWRAALALTVLSFGLWLVAPMVPVRPKVPSQSVVVSEENL